MFNNTGYILNNATVRINVDSNITLKDIRVVGNAVGNSSLTFYGNTITINGTTGSMIQSLNTNLGTTFENNVVLASSNSTSIYTGILQHQLHHEERGGRGDLGRHEHLHVTDLCERGNLADQRHSHPVHTGMGWGKRHCGHLRGGEWWHAWRHGTKTAPAVTAR